MLVCGGTECDDVTNFGAKKGETGPTMLPQNVFFSDVLSTEPRFVLLEISGLKTIEYYDKRIGHKYALEGIQLSPLGFAFPMRRKKLFVWGTHRWKTKFNGSATEFIELFARRRTLTASAYLIETHEARFVEDRTRAAGQGDIYGPWDASHPLTIPLRDQLSCSAVGRLAEHTRTMETERTKRFINASASHDSGAGGIQLVEVEGSDEESDADKIDCWFTDLEQNDTWVGAGQVLPALVTHSMMADLVSGKILTAPETLVAVGEAYECGSLVGAFGDDFDYECCISAVITKLNGSHAGRKAIKYMAGNCQVTYCLGTWLLYCLASTQVSYLSCSSVLQTK